MAEQAGYTWIVNVAENLLENGKLQHPDGNQWIVRNSDHDSLPYSAVFYCDDILMKLNGEDHLFFAGDDYLSEVSVEPIVQLDNSIDFDEAIGILKKHIALGTVLRSRNRDEFNREASHFEECLSSVYSKAFACPDRANALLQLCRFFKKHHYQLPAPFVRSTSANQYYTSTLNAAKDYFEAKANSLCPEILLKNEDKIIKYALQKVVHDYQQQLLSHCTSEFLKEIEMIRNEQIFLITLADIELFLQLEKNITAERFKDALKIIRGNFLMVIQGIPEEIIGGSRNTSNQIFYFVLKRLMEVSKKLSDILRLKEVVTYETDKWTVVNTPKDHKESLLEESLRQQLKMLVKLANHYEPGTKTVHQRMPYNFKYVKIENPLQDDLYVFLCFLDDSLNVFMSRYLLAGPLISNLTPLNIFENHISSGSVTYDVMNSLCSITQHVLDFLGQFFAMIINTANTTTQEILQKQFSILERGLTEIELRDYLNVFISCWQLCNSALENVTSRLSGDCFKQHITRIQNDLLLIVSLVLDKNENLTQMFEFFKRFEEFLIALRNLDLTWYVRLQDNQCRTALVNMEAIELVNNKWKETVHQCYVVKNDKLFTTYIYDRTIPKHYQVAILECFLKNIIYLAQKWTNESNQLDALFLFIAIISYHFTHFKRQPDYIDFETFFSETVEPFWAAVENIALPEEINNQTRRIIESFRLIENTNSTGIDKLLKLLHKEDPKIDVEKLKNAFKIYQKCFKEHIVENTSLNYNEKVTQIIESVQSKIKPLATSLWSEEFKQKNLPEIVADLAAAWSMIASKGSASSDRFIIPHSVQILCILRLLSVDQCGVGVANHLAQVLAGQGKSMILGLIAALLALFGHNVSVNCYSRYLAERDADNFKELFQLLNIRNRISYTTISDMMDNHTMYLTDRTLNNMGLTQKILSNPEQNGISRNNSILLIDEMDTMYRNKCILTIQPQILGLDVVQLKIWDLIQDGDTNCTSIKAKIYKFVSTPNDARVYNLKMFIEKSQKYSILVQGRKELLESVVTNRTLFSKHLHVMILSALKVHREPINSPFFKNYKLYKEERITCRNHQGKFTPSCVKGYYNTFIYFKLKGNNFMQNVSRCESFGYFVICVGELSYVKLLASNSLILGVTGNLIELDSFEKNAIENYYKIEKLSIMPYFFGLRLLKFNKINDFKCISTEVHWINSVIKQIHTITSTDRSVLVFFDTEVNINKFKQKFVSQLGSFNLLTVDTEAETKEQFINDAGFVKTVTLATRDMGRGVDFKSSATVEKNGGVHVIQTFFSLDINEERQIQGRTTRKTHHGSYEQIVCSEHLVNLQLINPKTSCDSVCYDQLDSARKNMAKKNCDVMAKKIGLANVKHAKTVEFYSRLQ